jgi:heat shock protein HslJ
VKTHNGKRFGSFLILLTVVAGLALIGCTSQEAADPAPGVVTEIVWEWESLREQPGQEKTDIPNPENYTLILRQDGTFSGQADCNQIAGTYEGTYSFTLGPSTLAACGSDSLDQQYLQLLGTVVTGGPYGELFALETAGGAQRMEFRNGGAAPAQ